MPLHASLVPASWVHASRKLGRLLLGLTFVLSVVGCQQRILRPDREVQVESPRPAAPPVLSEVFLRRGFSYGVAAPGQLQKVYYVPRGKGLLYEKLIGQFLSSESLSVQHMPDYLQDSKVPQGGTDLLFVRDTEANIAHIEEFITTLETNVPQVEVEAKIVEILVSDRFEAGATTTLLERNANPRTLFDSGSSRFNTKTFLESIGGGGLTSFQGGILNFGTIQDRFLMDAIFEALLRNENTEIVATPILRVLSGFTGKVSTGERTPIQTARVINNTVTVDTQFEDTGVKLEVTPTVVGEDDVRMTVVAVVSVVTGFTAASTTGITSPIISQRDTDTTVMVKSGHTLVLGGLKSKQVVEVESRFPVLGKIPIIKHLFRSVSREHVTTQLYFFITPRITNDQGQYGGSVLYPPGNEPSGN